MDQQNFEPVKRRRGRPSKKDLAEREARQLAWENQQNAEMQHGLGAAPALQQQPQHVTQKTWKPLVDYHDLVRQTHEAMQARQRGQSSQDQTQLPLPGVMKRQRELDECRARSAERQYANDQPESSRAAGLRALLPRPASSEASRPSPRSEYYRDLQEHIFQPPSADTGYLLSQNAQSSVPYHSGSRILAGHQPSPTIGAAQRHTSGMDLVNMYAASSEGAIPYPTLAHNPKACGKEISADHHPAYAICYPFFAYEAKKVVLEHQGLPVNQYLAQNIPDPPLATDNSGIEPNIFIAFPNVIADNTPPRFIKEYGPAPTGTYAAAIALFNGNVAGSESPDARAVGNTPANTQAAEGKIDPSSFGPSFGTLLATQFEASNTPGSRTRYVSPYAPMTALNAGHSASSDSADPGLKQTAHVSDHASSPEAAKVSRLSASSHAPSEDIIAEIAAADPDTRYLDVQEGGLTRHRNSVASSSETINAADSLRSKAIVQTEQPHDLVGLKQHSNGNLNDLSLEEDLEFHAAEIEEETEFNSEEFESLHVGDFENFDTGEHDTGSTAESDTGSERSVLAEHEFSDARYGIAAINTRGPVTEEPARERLYVDYDAPDANEEGDKVASSLIESPIPNELNPWLPVQGDVTYNEALFIVMARQTVPGLGFRTNAVQIWKDGQRVSIPNADQWDKSVVKRESAQLHANSSMHRILDKQQRASEPAQDWRSYQAKQREHRNFRPFGGDQNVLRTVTTDQVPEIEETVEVAPGVRKNRSGEYHLDPGAEYSRASPYVGPIHPFRQAVIVGVGDEYDEESEKRKFEVDEGESIEIESVGTESGEKEAREMQEEQPARVILKRGRSVSTTSLSSAKRVKYASQLDGADDRDDEEDEHAPTANSQEIDPANVTNSWTTIDDQYSLSLPNGEEPLFSPGPGTFEEHVARYFQTREGYTRANAIRDIQELTGRKAPQNVPATAAHRLSDSTSGDRQAAGPIEQYHETLAPEQSVSPSGGRPTALPFEHYYEKFFKGSHIRGDVTPPRAAMRGLSRPLKALKNPRILALSGKAPPGGKTPLPTRISPRTTAKSACNSRFESANSATSKKPGEASSGTGLDASPTAYLKRKLAEMQDDAPLTFDRPLLYWRTDADGMARTNEPPVDPIAATATLRHKMIADHISHAYPKVKKGSYEYERLMRHEERKYAGNAIVRDTAIAKRAKIQQLLNNDTDGPSRWRCIHCGEVMRTHDGEEIARCGCGRKRDDVRAAVYAKQPEKAHGFWQKEFY